VAAQLIIEAMSIVWCRRRISDVRTRIEGVLRIGAGGGEGGWRRWGARWWSAAAKRVVRRSGGGATASPTGGCVGGGAGPQVKLGLGFFGWRRRRSLVTPSAIEAWGAVRTR
jgi:hypothetical protein